MSDPDNVKPILCEGFPFCKPQPDPNIKNITNNTKIIKSNSKTELIEVEIRLKQSIKILKELILKK